MSVREVLEDLPEGSIVIDEEGREWTRAWSGWRLPIWRDETPSIDALNLTHLPEFFYAVKHIPGETDLKFAVGDRVRLSEDVHWVTRGDVRDGVVTAVTVGAAYPYQVTLDHTGVPCAYPFSNRELEAIPKSKPVEFSGEQSKAWSGNDPDYLLPDFHRWATVPGEGENHIARIADALEEIAHMMREDSKPQQHWYSPPDTPLPTYLFN